MFLLPRIRPSAALPVLALALAWSAPAAATPEREPLLGLYLQPTLSLTLPSSRSAPVVETYGVAHPTGAVGFEVRLVERLSLLVELEAQTWKGSYDFGENSSTTLRFLNYWIHVRFRTLLWRVGPLELLADGVVGLIVGREDGERFRASGQGLALGAGAVLRWPLGQYVALTLSTMVEGGWAWYSIQSSQTRDHDGEYRLDWPRFLVSIGVHGYVAHRSPPTAP
jgi:hypothetical protein